jgi:hypothetical protein
MAKAKRGPRTASGKRLGIWKVKRVGDAQILLTIPAGMSIKGQELAIEDVVAAASNYLVVRKGRVLRCCSGNVAIA